MAAPLSLEVAMACMVERFPMVDERILRYALLDSRDIQDAAAWIVAEVLPEMEDEQPPEEQMQEAPPKGATRVPNGESVRSIHATSSECPPQIQDADTCEDSKNGFKHAIAAKVVESLTGDQENIDDVIENGRLDASLGAGAVNTDGAKEMISGIEQIAEVPLPPAHGAVSCDSPFDSVEGVRTCHEGLTLSAQKGEVTESTEATLDAVEFLGTLGSVSIMAEHEIDGPCEAGSQYWDVKDALPLSPASRNQAGQGIGGESFVDEHIGGSSSAVDVGLNLDAEEKLISGSPEASSTPVLSSEREIDIDHNRGGGSNSESLWESLTSSSQAGFVRVEDLDQLVLAATENKEDLKDCIQDVKKLAAITFVKENEALAAQKDAENAEKVVMVEVEKLRRDLLRAREGLESRAGEVYGERAVLSTEARELRARVRSVKDTREAARKALEELRCELMHRMEVALKQLENASCEKKAKEDHALALLAKEQEEMAKIGKQSEALDAEAEACTKLREFLMARDKDVDALQGELDVLCEDVETLKAQLSAPSKKHSAYADTASIVESLAEPVTAMLDLYRALDQVSLHSVGTTVAVSSGPDSSANAVSRMESPDLRQDDSEEAAYAANMAVLGGGSTRSLTYGSQDLNMFSSLPEDDAGWEMVRGISGRDSRGTSPVESEGGENSCHNSLSSSDQMERGVDY